MAESGLPCLDLLEATPGILRGLTTELTEEDARWKPAPERFSVAEVLAHLAHSESHCYRMRLDRFMAETHPEFDPECANVTRPVPQCPSGEAFEFFPLGYLGQNAIPGSLRTPSNTRCEYR